MSTNLAYLEITIAGTKVVFSPCDPPQDLYTRRLKKKKKKKSDQQTSDFRRFSISLMYGCCIQLK